MREQHCYLSSFTVPLRRVLRSLVQHSLAGQNLDPAADLGRRPGLLPVVSRGDIRHVVGIITPQGLIQFLQSAARSAVG